MKKVPLLFLSIVICQLAGVIGSFFTTPAIPEWYASLNKPSFNPPSWLFGPVWLTLFLLMGIALYLVWSQGIKEKTVQLALIIFGVHLVFNILWSFFFFGLKNPLLGLIDIFVLLGLIVLTGIKFYAISRPAGLLLLPYLFWVGFATILNFFIWRLN